MRSLWRSLDARDFELEPVPFLEVMNAPVEREQELKPVVRGTSVHIIAGYDSTVPAQKQRVSVRDGRGSRGLSP